MSFKERSGSFPKQPEIPSELIVVQKELAYLKALVRLEQEAVRIQHHLPLLVDDYLLRLSKLYQGPLWYPMTAEERTELEIKRKLVLENASLANYAYRAETKALNKLLLMNESNFWFRLWYAIIWHKIDGET